VTGQLPAPPETVFYLDLLGFRSLAEGDGRPAVEALTAVAELFAPDSPLHAVGEWSHRYALSDSVFLCHPSPGRAILWAAQTARRLPKVAAGGEIVLVRGGMARGEVRHLRSVFGGSNEPANLLGVAVSQAVDLESKTTEKGPRIFVDEHLAREAAARDPAIADWLLAPTPAPGVWDLLWLLPDSPRLLAKESAWRDLRWLTSLSLQLLADRGGHPRFGAHYRGFARLAVRSLLRIADWAGTPVPQRSRLAEMLPRRELVAVLDRTAGIPDLDALLLLDAADRLARVADEPSAR
jgi:hypothetical protein